ncbi:hypothetical protein [Thiohalocapsa sp.]|uniref:hypothetical protein n=1 Tax=Thiohalocapsa sp. TaxID=2497641 RepID=UPI0025F6738C|nr:hypothetical protein [Thiohalocapsa sp.]
MTGQYGPNRGMANLSPRQDRMFNNLDKNNNGTIDRQEAQGNPSLSRHFDAADTYGNQAITPSEFAAFEAHEQESGNNQGYGPMSGQSEPPREQQSPTSGGNQ